MRFMNEHDIRRAEARYGDHPVLGPVVCTLHNLMIWTNANSDGWPYWSKPARAASGLMELVERDGTSRWRLDDERADVTYDEVKAAMRPVKAFRTRHKADFDIVEVGLDTASSASRQHYIDTGKYLHYGESYSVHRSLTPEVDSWVHRGQA